VEAIIASGWQSWQQDKVHEVVNSAIGSKYEVYKTIIEFCI
jgi:hypothetical protein